MTEAKPGRGNARDLYTLMSWLSPAFPVGSFSYSHGIEYAVSAGLVRDRQSLLDWIASVLLHGFGMVDATLFRAAYAASGERLKEVAALAAAMRGTSELARESSAQGQAFASTVRAAWSVDSPDGAAYCVAVASACAGRGVPVDAALTAYLHAFASNLVSAGVRLVPLGQTDGQRVIAALQDVVMRVVEESSDDLSDIGSATPVVDWTSMMHETQYTRLFRS
jgi:urease accessory protein